LGFLGDDDGEGDGDDAPEEEVARLALSFFCCVGGSLGDRRFERWVDVEWESRLGIVAKKNHTISTRQGMVALNDRAGSGEFQRPYGS